MSIADLETLYTAAVAAIDAAEYDTAITKLMAVKLRLATTPNLTRATGGGGSQGISWNAAEIDSLIAQCRQLKSQALAAASGGMQSSRIVYSRVVPYAMDTY